MEKGTLVSGAKRSAIGTRGAKDGVGVPFPGAAWWWLTAEAGAGVGSAVGGGLSGADEGSEAVSSWVGGGVGSGSTFLPERWLRSHSAS